MLFSVISRASQWFIHTVLRVGTYCLYHNRLVAGHLKELLTNNAMGRKSSCPHMEKYVYETITDCRSCAQNRKNNNKQRKLRSFLPPRSLAYVALVVFSWLQKRRSGSHLTVVLKDRNTKLTKMRPSAWRTGTAVIIIFSNDCRSNFDI